MASLGLHEDEVEPYGHFKAKVLLKARDRMADQAQTLNPKPLTLNPKS